MNFELKSEFEKILFCRITFVTIDFVEIFRIVNVFRTLVEMVHGVNASIDMGIRCGKKPDYKCQCAECDNEKDKCGPTCCNHTLYGDGNCNLKP